MKVGTYGVTLSGNTTQQWRQSLISELSALGIPVSQVYDPTNQSPEQTQEAQKQSRYNLYNIDSNTTETDMNSISQQIASDPSRTVVIFDTMSGTNQEQQSTKSAMQALKSRFANGHIFNRSEGINFLQHNLQQQQ